VEDALRTLAESSQPCCAPSPRRSRSLWLSEGQTSGSRRKSRFSHKLRSDVGPPRCNESAASPREPRECHPGLPVKSLVRCSGCRCPGNRSRRTPDHRLAHERHSLSNLWQMRASDNCRRIKRCWRFETNASVIEHPTSHVHGGLSATRRMRDHLPQCGLQNWGRRRDIAPHSPPRSKPRCPSTAHYDMLMMS
jgi:hypothetical protein